MQIPAHNFVDLQGRKFGRFTALAMTGRDQHRNIVWQCRCDCGTIKDVSGNSLRKGTTVSCGCFKRDDTIARFTKHGHAAQRRSAEYDIWAAMIHRCHRPKASNFKNYGGRGIFVCPEWRESFAAFLADMGCRPSAKHSVERVDNDGPYSPSNCVWATRRRQSVNTRRTVFIRLFGEDLPLSTVRKTAGVNRTTYADRRARGLSVEEALGVEINDAFRVAVFQNLQSE